MPPAASAEDALYKRAIGKALRYMDPIVKEVMLDQPVLGQGRAHTTAKMATESATIWTDYTDWTNWTD